MAVCKMFAIFATLCCLMTTRSVYIYIKKQNNSRLPCAGMWWFTGLIVSIHVFYCIYIMSVIYMTKFKQFSVTDGYQWPPLVNYAEFRRNNQWLLSYLAHHKFLTSMCERALMPTGIHTSLGAYIHMCTQACVHMQAEVQDRWQIQFRWRKTE